MLSAEKSFETLPIHDGTTFITESFAFNLYISTPLITIYSIIIQNFCCYPLKLIAYSFSAVMQYLLTRALGLYQESRYLFLLSICTD